MEKTEVLQMSPLVWAYMGDAIYESYIREYVIKQGLCKNGLLHKKSIKYVSANGQVKILKNIEEFLTDEEKDIVRRGRNANPHSHAKNADIVDYKYATGFEALIGFLYLTGEKERLNEILEKAVGVA
ncbi:MAG: Mini-ribonuclease 3 [Clostridia bacterium]|nr:Mini-ribonuclease 3 [Clostridia bacterium]MBR2290122.1 Mini-ribonuclease 3 [Clostridia bacterium]